MEMALILGFTIYLAQKINKWYNIKVTNATIAQLVEHLIRNERVVGSNPISSSSKKVRAPFSVLVFFIIRL